MKQLREEVDEIIWLILFGILLVVYALGVLTAVNRPGYPGVCFM